MFQNCYSVHCVGNKSCPISQLYCLKKTHVYLNMSVLLRITYTMYKYGTCTYNNIPILPSFMTYHRVGKKSTTTGASSGGGTAYPSGAPQFILCF